MLFSKPITRQLEFICIWFKNKPKPTLSQFNFRKKLAAKYLPLLKFPENANYPAALLLFFLHLQLKRHATSLKHHNQLT